MLVLNISAALASAIRRHRRYRQLHDELSRMNDRELSELGISRYDIERIARDAAPRERAPEPAHHFPLTASRAA